MYNRSLSRFLSIVLILIVPTSLMLADTGTAAMLYTSGAVMINN